MLLNIRELLCEDGSIPFSAEIDPAELDFPSILRFPAPPSASGRVTAQAGLLTLTGELRADPVCICDRCGREYVRNICLPLDAELSAELQDEENPDVFLLQDDSVDLDEVLSTAFILGLDSKMLCRPDCKGVCPTCGRNLNDGPCGCGREVDSRLAVLGQLLEQD